MMGKINALNLVFAYENDAGDYLYSEQTHEIWSLKTHSNDRCDLLQRLNRARVPTQLLVKR